MPPELIAGRYRVEREVGRGGMGSVWLCRDERLGRAVAVKQVGGLPGESSMHLARALREARHSAALNHPNVVAIFDAIEEHDHVWLVMEYIPSRTLDEKVGEDGPLEARLAARIGADVADGLAAAHALGTVHRDVKPSNVLVREDDGRALIADFGIARTVGQEQLTRSGLVTGTPAYFAPELARGEEPSPASDVWALGVSLYVAVQGEPPYEEQANAIALLNTIASQPPPAADRAGPMASVMRRMLEPDPSTRCTMAEAADALRRVAHAAAEPVAEPVKAAADPVPTPVRGSRPPDTVPTAVVSPEPPQVAPPAAAPAAPAAPAATAATAPSRRRPALLAVLAVVVVALVTGTGWWLSSGSGDDDQGEPRTSDTPPGPSKHASRSTSKSPSAKPTHETSASSAASTPSATTEPSSSTEPSATTSGTPSTSTGGASGAESPTELVADYYALLPEDTEDAWALLTPQLQDRIGRGTFDGFWATIDDVTAGDTEQAGTGLVRVTLTYTTDGRKETETRQLAVTDAGDGYLISEDQGAV